MAPKWICWRCRAFKRGGDKWRHRCPGACSRSGRSKWLPEKGTIIIAAGGGGIPMGYEPACQRRGLEGVIDKDRSLLRIAGAAVGAGVFIMATDAKGCVRRLGKPTARAFRRASPETMRGFSFPAGSMGPKVDAACHCAEATRRRAAIGALKDRHAAWEVWGPQ
jgi:carbamate kinase